MRKFAYATVFAAAISAPVFAGALMDNSVVSVLGAPDENCASGCAVGGAEPTNPGNAQGGYSKITIGGLTESSAGTFATGGLTGRGVINAGPSFTGSQSGNFSDPTSPHGHCTGVLC